MNSLKPGVYIATRRDGTVYYRSSITYNNKHISLGSYSTEDEAHIAYLDADSLLHDNSMSIDSYSSKHVLSFEKWVVLCNFRDNGLYFSNPIYVRPKLFYYYFSPEDFFIFSREDLFYYSAHKIQKRGGHYFLSDYGSQVNLLSRYGIQSHAVAGRDYIFLNGNHQDMQYGNIQIVNPYHGVICSDSTMDKYIAQIHINGYTRIGVYGTAIEAAIAYNKAIDILKNAGLDKQYPTNYIDGLSAKSYADIYSQVEISQAILNYLAE